VVATVAPEVYTVPDCAKAARATNTSTPKATVSFVNLVSWFVRNPWPHALKDMPLSGYLSRQKKTNKT
jgi:hypothetical protein